MKRMMLLFGALMVVTMMGCENIDPKSAMKDRKNETFKKWAESRLAILENLAPSEFKSGHLAGAEAKAREAIKLDPDNKQMKLLLGMILIEKNQAEDAAEVLSKLTTQEPDWSDAHFYLGVAREHAGLLEDALKSYTRAYHLNPASIEPVLAGAEVLIALQRIADAQAFLEGRIDMRQGTARSFELAGRIASQLEQHEKAAWYYKQACLMDEENLRYPEMLAEAQYKAGQLDQAIVSLERIMERPEAKKHVRWLMMMGDCYTASERYGKAISVYTAATRVEGKLAQPWIGLAKVYLCVGENDLATKSAKHAHEIDASNAEASQLLAYALLKQDDVAEAARVLRKAQMDHPRDATISCLLGRTYAMAGQHQQASKFYRYALKQDPNCNLARQLLSLQQD